MIEYKDGRKHNIVIGNIFDKKVYNKIEKIINGQKAELIVERMVAGFRNVPNSSIIIIVVLQKWYAMLNEGGLIFVETPVFLEDVIVEWVKVLRSDYVKSLDVEFDPGQGSLRIHKLVGAPKVLPVLSVLQVNEIFKK